jgi:hypothetical protein
MTSATFGDEIKERGFVFVPESNVGSKPMDAFSRIGNVSTLEGFAATQSLVPRNAVDAPPNTYSGNFGKSDFPLHTDLAHWAVPPRFLALRCTKGTPHVLTRIIDANVLIEAFGYIALRRTLVHPRRPLNGRKQLLRLLNSSSGGASIFRWDSLFLRSASVESENVFTRVLEFLKKARPHEIGLVNSGDTLIVDNWRMLHGRSSAPEGASERQMERAYLSTIY